MEETPSPLPPRGVIGSLAALFGRGRSRSVCVQKPTASRPSNFARTSSYEGNAFDSPLQEAIGLLEEVQQRLAKKSPVEAELIGCALGCLHERDLLGAKTIQQMNDAAGGPRVDAQLEDWLDAMQWLQKADGDEADEAPFGLSKRDATTGCGDSSAALTTTETAALNEEGSAAALAMPQCINPKVSTLLLSGAEARVAAARARAMHVGVRRAGAGRAHGGARLAGHRLGDLQPKRSHLGAIGKCGDVAAFPGEGRGGIPAAGVPQCSARRVRHPRRLLPSDADGGAARAGRQPSGALLCHLRGADARPRPHGPQQCVSRRDGL